MAKWNRSKTADLYKIDSWGSGYFAINENGNLCVKPSLDSSYSVDLKMLVDELRKRKVHPPILIRVMDILEDRIKRLCGAFHEAIESTGYQGRYFPIFPVKVNQQRQVVEAILRYGAPHGIGLEAGSKAELLAVLALTENPDSPIVCNGYKDEEFVSLAGMAHKMGKRIYPVIEKYTELERFIAHYKKTGIMPLVGVRIKLLTRGAGQWAASSGENSKFGLRIPEVITLVRRLKNENLLDRLKMVHFHLGSQITEIKVIKQGLVETARIYIELAKLGAELEYVDVGGGLGVDYEGSSHGTFAGVNYSLQEYANDVVYRIQQLCDEQGVKHPTIFSESGRFLCAHYSLLITNISTAGELSVRDYELSEVSKQEGPLGELFEIAQHVDGENFLESYHDAILYRNESNHLFSSGYMSLNQMALVEQVFSEIMSLVAEKIQNCEKGPIELENLEQGRIQTCFANLSVFQSLPDSWAIGQVFPVIPIHRLNEFPEKKGVIVDLTCDSDGMIRQYLGDGTQNSHIPLHEIRPDESYYVGIFLVGAYQETLGELHNLFGDTHAVQIEICGENDYRLSSFIKGDTVKDVLNYVSYDTRELTDKMWVQIESAVAHKRLSLEESAQLMAQYEEGLFGYTYFEE